MFTHGGRDVADRSIALRHARAALASGRDDSSALAIGGFVVVMLDRDFAKLVGMMIPSACLAQPCPRFPNFPARHRLQ
jgi:hypothetical protein